MVCHLAIVGEVLPVIQYALVQLAFDVVENARAISSVFVRRKMRRERRDILIDVILQFGEVFFGPRVSDQLQQRQLCRDLQPIVHSEKFVAQSLRADRALPAEDECRFETELLVFRNVEVALPGTTGGTAEVHELIPDRLRNRCGVRVPRSTMGPPEPFGHRRADDIHATPFEEYAVSIQKANLRAPVVVAHETGPAHHPRISVAVADVDLGRVHPSRLQFPVVVRIAGQRNAQDPD